MIFRKERKLLIDRQFPFLSKKESKSGFALKKVQNLQNFHETKKTYAQT